MAPSSPPPLPPGVAAFCRAVPKAELHVHIEGTLEPELQLALAARNGLPPPYASASAGRALRDFTCLADFLALYYAGCSCLVERADFADLMAAYLARASAEGVRRAEIMFDPQSHLGRGLGWEAILGGLEDGMAAGRAASGISAALILCFLRHEGAEKAGSVLTDFLALPQSVRQSVCAVGLDSNEIYPTPEPWAPVFARAAAAGLKTVCHAGEEESAAYMRQVGSLPPPPASSVRLKPAPRAPSARPPGCPPAEPPIPTIHPTSRRTGGGHAVRRPHRPRRQGG